MRIDEADNTLTFLFDIVLGQTNELHIVIIQPLGVAFVQRQLSTWLFLVVLHQLHNPFAFVLAFTAIGRITYDNHHRAVALDHVGLIGLAAKPLGKEGAWLVVALFEGVGQIDMQALVRIVLIARFA